LSNGVLKFVNCVYYVLSPETLWHKSSATDGAGDLVCLSSIYICWNYVGMIQYLLICVYDDLEFEVRLYVREHM